MRLIDADALWKEFCRSEAIEERYGSGVLEIAGNIIDNAPTIDAVPRWIPCEERMPEKYDQYLCCTREGVFHTPCLDDSELTITWAKDEDVVAWMPLPEPYEWERSK